MKNFYHRTWAEIDLDVLKKNIDIIRGYAGGKDIIAIVKANAYGHGDAGTAKALNGCGVRHFAVSNLWEAQNLSSAKVTATFSSSATAIFPSSLTTLTRITYSPWAAFPMRRNFRRLP